MTEIPTKSDAVPQRFSRCTCIVLVVVPLLLFVAIGWFAPNFVSSSQTRLDPMGGDFLQEYAGGVLFLDGDQNNQLYNVDVCREIQHDVQLLGFQWDKSRFFPMVYPPFYYAAVSPLSRLDYAVAMRVWLLLMTLFLIVALLWLRRSLSIHTGLLVVACLAAPLLLSLTTGQKSTLLFLILAGTFCLLRSEKPFAAGAFFGLIAFKPHLGIPIGIFMLLRRQWSFVLGCYFTVGCLIAASLATGFDICTDYFGVTMGFTDYVHNGGYHLDQGFSLWSAWQLAVTDADFAKYATIASTLFVLGATAFFLRKPSSHRGDNLLRSFSAMTIATVLVAPHLYAYDLTILVLPVILLSHLAIRQDRHWSFFAPVVALSVVLFGMQPLISIAGSTGWNLGVPLILLAWGFVIWSNREICPSVSPLGSTLETVASRQAIAPFPRSD